MSLESRSLKSDLEDDYEQQRRKGVPKPYGWVLAEKGKIAQGLLGNRIKEVVSRLESDSKFLRTVKWTLFEKWPEAWDKSSAVQGGATDSELLLPHRLDLLCQAVFGKPLPRLAGEKALAYAEVLSGLDSFAQLCLLLEFALIPIKHERWEKLKKFGEPVEQFEPTEDGVIDLVMLAPWQERSYIDYQRLLAKGFITSFRPTSFLLKPLATERYFWVRRWLLRAWFMPRIDVIEEIKFPDIDFQKPLLPPEGRDFSWPVIVNDTLEQKDV